MPKKYPFKKLLTVNFNISGPFVLTDRLNLSRDIIKSKISSEEICYFFKQRSEKAYSHD